MPTPRLIVAAIAVLSASVLAQSFDAQPITSSNRAHPGAMWGGWGPHLRSVMEAPDGSIWYADDTAGSVNVNNGVRYFKQTASGSWQHMATTGFYPAFGRIQQNTAQVMRDRFIHSFGVDVQRRWLMDCYFDTTNPSVRACNAVFVSGAPLILPANSNYVGAAVSPTGARLVWWTTVGNPGLWSYVYNFGGGWNGPVHTAVSVGGNNYGFLGYVHATFRSNNQVSFVGETYQGSSFYAISGSFQLGQPAALTLHPSAIYGTDLYHDAASGDLHALMYTPGATQYHYLPVNGGWSFVESFPGTLRSRFVPDDGSGMLWLVLGGHPGTPSGIQLRGIPRARIDGPIDWLSLPVIDVPTPAVGFGSPSALYVPSRSYQTQPVSKLRFAAVGQIPNDHLTRSWELTSPWLSVTQPDGAGTPAFIDDANLVSGRWYRNLFSIDTTGATGAGPHLGLHASTLPDVQFLVTQMLLPEGAAPFSFEATGGAAAFGPITVAQPITIDGICFDYTGGVVGATSRVGRFILR